jgi:F like protein
VKAAEFNKQLRTRRREAETELAALAEVYERLLSRVAREALQGFRGQAVTAAGWQPPPEGNILNPANLAAYAAAQLSRLHKAILFKIAGPTLARVNISWDVTNPLAEQILAAAGKRTGVALGEAVQPLLRETIFAAYEQGLSVVDAADLIQQKLSAAKPAQARMLARTDLNGLANGSSVMAARMVGIAYKQWVTANDDRVREQHVEADGQMVPVDQPFQVCGEDLMFPGDPAASDECAINCRCTVVYADAPAEAEILGSAAPPPVTVQVAAATTAPETTAVLERMNELVTELRLLVEEHGRPLTRRVTVARNEDGEIVSMTIRDER